MRTINSPGIQITEIDDSAITQTVVGTNIYLMGYASQGPTDEVLSISSISELQDTYGTPQTAAERYFYYAANRVLNSAGNLYTSRMPYGSGSGSAFSDKYSALFYPVVSSGGGFVIGTPSQYTLDDADYQAIIQNNFNWVSTAIQTSAEPVATWDGQNMNAGFVIINESQTIIDDAFQGYYVSLADNTGFGPDTSFTAVTAVYSLTAVGDNTNNWYQIPNSFLAFNLSGSNLGGSSNSISELIESTPLFNFADPYFSDSLILNLFKVRSSIYTPELLSISLVETYIGSLDATKVTASSQGGTQRSFYLENAVNQQSSNVQLFVNPAISTQTQWTNLSSINPNYTVTVDGNTNALFAEGVYTPANVGSDSKNVGNIVTKLERGLSLVENPDIINLDVIIDAGLTTMFANTSGGGVYDDSLYYDITQLQDPSSSYIQNWSAVYNMFADFVSETRKDCMAIVDPLRQTFINGKNSKVLSVAGNTFSQNIYTPLNNTFAGADCNYMATYGNWVQVYDQFSDSQVWLPFSGFAAEIYGNNDSVAYPWFAPAGLNRGIVTGITDIAFNPNQKQRDFLYTISVNPVVFFPSDGYVVYGQKTLQKKPSAFDRVNVRRLFLALEKATMQTLKYFVFEPNTLFTRTQVVNDLTPIFESAKNTEGVYDYLIVCDDRNNTPDTIDLNELHVDIYIKPVRAAEFILVNFIATRTSANFQELIG